MPWYIMVTTDRVADRTLTKEETMDINKMDINKNDTAVVVTDPQNDVLSTTGVAWGLVGESIRENNTVEHIEQPFKAAKKNGYDVFISPHYYYPIDQGWRSGGAVEKMMHETKMFGRGGALTLEGFRGSGADNHASARRWRVRVVTQLVARRFPRSSRQRTLAIPLCAPAPGHGPPMLRLAARREPGERPSGTP
ncbi:MAG: hypothetical protein ACRED0_11140 [Gammaproteobacteria bacterium]